MEEEKPFIFAGFGLPTRSCLVCFHIYDDILLTEGCREKRLAGIIRDKIRRAYANKEKSPGRLRTIPYNKIIRNCMELSGIFTVQALCLFA